MNAFFIIAGVVVTIIGVSAISVIAGLWIAVRYFGLVISFGTLVRKEEDDNDDEQGD